MHTDPKTPWFVCSLSLILIACGVSLQAAATDAWCDEW